MTKIKTTSEIGVELIQSIGGDDIIINAAMVSTLGGIFTGTKPTDFPSMTIERKTGFINTLIRQKHGSPFEHSSITFRVHAPICVWREWHRHRIGFSYNEESARYKQLDPTFYIPAPDRPMIPVEGFKSMRPGFRLADQDEYRRLVEVLTFSYQASYDAYETLLGDDPKHPQYDRGLARDVLPVGIYSSCWVTCNPRSLMSFLALRTHHPEATHVSYPLWEIDIAAQACEKIFAQGWPITYQAFVDYGRVAP